MESPTPDVSQLDLTTRLLLDECTIFFRREGAPITPSLLRARLRMSANEVRRHLTTLQTMGFLLPDSCQPAWEIVPLAQGAFGAHLHINRDETPFSADARSA